MPKRGKKKEVLPETVTESIIDEILDDGNNQQSTSINTKRGCNKKETVASPSYDNHQQLIADLLNEDLQVL
ncbi:unnamed protein product [Rhizophagus irregularis]|uniref:Uncharacterized protein n=1 Tax=Rhizophagus irregularis TaxID=588596 RepID=A0A916E4U8_9GLOM|nr:unnamed protein product [Rhizophagus irregularis]